jgi:hypothetical protein
MTTLQRLRAVLGLKKTNIPHTLTLAKLIYSALVANAAQFPALPVTAAQLLALITALEDAQLAVKRSKNLAPARDRKRDELVTALEQIQSYVQLLCDANPEQAGALIKAAALKQALYTPPDRPMIKLKLTVASGGVILKANASALKVGKRAKAVTYNWQSTGDGGKTIVNQTPTPVSKTTITGLTSLTEYGFRVCVTDSNGQGPWTDWFHVMVR